MPKGSKKGLVPAKDGHGDTIKILPSRSDSKSDESIVTGPTDVDRKVFMRRVKTGTLNNNHTRRDRQRQSRSRMIRYYRRKISLTVIVEHETTGRKVNHRFTAIRKIDTLARKVRWSSALSITVSGRR